MDVAIMYSGGKDSTLAIEYALNKGYNIKYLLSVKPNRTDCYLFHFATVEHTKELAKILGLKHILINCDVADPVKEAELVKNVVLKEDKVDALILGGIGLQLTQLGSLQRALMPYNIEVYAAHAGFDHDKMMLDMINRGYEIMITQIASDGLKNWLGKSLTLYNFDEFVKDSIKYGFHVGGEGGYYDSLVVDGPIFDRKLEILECKNVLESDYNGYVLVNKLEVVNKSLAKVQ